MHKIVLLGLTAAFGSLLSGVIFFYQRNQPPLVLQANSRISWHKCDSFIVSNMPLKCGYFYPSGDSGAFGLPFTIFTYDGQDSQPDPLVYLAGGPGAGMQTDADSLQTWAYWLEEADLKRDLIIFDQRGLKPGKPYWDCDAYNKLNQDLLSDHLTLEQEYRRTQPILQRCLHEFDAWLRSPAVGVSDGLKSFSSGRGAEDLNDMLAVLGYRQWNLWGVSYGTRLALVAAQREPGRIRSMVLDSPYPLNRGRFSEKPEMYAQALQRFWQICRSNTSVCGVELADPEALFWRVIDRLARHPGIYRVRQPDGSSIPVVLNEHRFFSMLLFALYDERLYPDLARGLLLLDEQQTGKSTAPPDGPILYLLNLFVGAALDRGFNSLIFYAIECNDNPLEAVGLYDAASAAYPLLQRFIGLEGEYNPCHLPLFEPEGMLQASPAPTAPTLIVSGELDPVTPVDWGEMLARQLPRAHLLVVSETGHALLNRGTCGPELLNQFLEQPGASVDAKSLDCRLD